MKAKPYLSKLGKEYFKVLVGILSKRGQDLEEFETELNILANEYANYHEAQVMINERTPYVVYNTGAQQIAPWVTHKEKSMANIIKLSPKFGLNPKDFDAIKDSIPKTEEISALDKF